MPAPKAVLRDIADRNLDPGYAHSITGKDGRIIPPAAIKPGAKHAGVHINQRILPVPEEHPVQNALKQLPVEEKPAAVEAEPVEAEKEDAELVPEVGEGETVVVASSKKLRAKKADKPAS